MQTLLQIKAAEELVELVEKYLADKLDNENSNI